MNVLAGVLRMTRRRERTNEVQSEVRLKLEELLRQAEEKENDSPESQEEDFLQQEIFVKRPPQGAQPE